MEVFVCKKNCKIGPFEYKIRKGDQFAVLRTIMNECVLIVEDSNKPNIITTETELRKYGSLIGSPVLGCC